MQKNSHVPKRELEFRDPKILPDVKFEQSKNLKPSKSMIEGEAELQIQKDPKQSAAAGIACIIYMSDKHYTPEEMLNTENKHFIHDKTVMFDLLYTFFVQKYGYKKEEISNIVVAHEHGKENKRCHMQCAVFFYKPCRKTIYPHVITLTHDGVTAEYLIMGQFCRNKNGLSIYCQKDGEFIVMRELEIDVKSRAATELNELAVNLYTATGTPHEIVKSLIVSNPGATLKMFSNIDRYLTKYHAPELPPFKWTIPEHILNSDRESFKCIVQHIKENFIQENVPRRMALIILSQKNMGKTMFVQSLVPHPDYLLYIRANMNADSFKNVSSARLLCLDDFGTFDKTQIEQFKGILSAQTVGVRAAYLNQNIPSLPCIFLTNNYDLAMYVFNATEHFGGRFNIVELQDYDKDYLGPAGTRKHEFSKVDISKMHLSERFLHNAKLKDMEYQLKKNEKKNMAPIFRIDNTVIQTKMNDDITIRKLKQELALARKSLADKEREIDRLHGRRLNNIQLDFIPSPRNDAFDLNLELNEAENRRLFPEFYENDA